jgi:hypothetical protein
VKDLLLVVWVALLARDPLLEQDDLSHVGHVLLDPWSPGVSINELIDPWASSGVSIDELIDPWAMAPPAAPSLDFLTFPKIDTHELKPFVEPALPFDKVDASELKPFPFET